MNYISKHFKLKDFCNYDTVKVYRILYEISPYHGGLRPVVHPHTEIFKGFLTINAWSSYKVSHCTSGLYVSYENFELLSQKKRLWNVEVFKCGLYLIAPCKIVLVEKFTLYKFVYNA